jgi:predicted SAM-dependent methyltransferase
MIILNLGCGDQILDGCINVDVASAREGKVPDVNCDIRHLDVFSDNYADVVLAVHVIEHFWQWEVIDILKEWVRVLKPGGTMVLECPNLISACQELLKQPEIGSRPDQHGQRTMWCFYGDPAWKDPLMCHRWLYTPQSLAQVMLDAGLIEVSQQPAQFKLKEPRDMRIVGIKPSKNA